MTKYLVSVVKHETAHKTAVIEVEAPNSRLARRAAKEQVLGGTSTIPWKEGPWPPENHYSIDSVQAIKPSPTPGKEGV